MIGAAIIAIWFLILDTFNGRPLYTPTVLGTALFGRGEGLSSPESMRVSWEMTLMFTWVHGMVFAVIGGSVSYLLRLIEKNADLGFGILLLFVVLEFGFIVAAFIFAEPILHALAWPAVLIGNLLATAGMAGYFWLHHPNLMIRP
ncbi:MAG: hypothetical protein IH856_16560 [Deltaproteobacteria bacterium]|nr:hypothetical protein [Deltaproteobacteria bacterium]